MPRFDTKFLTSNDAAALMDFLRAEWSKEHIMANSRQYLDCFFYDAENERYNIICAFGEDNAIEGFIAFVPASFYDKSLKANDFVWITNWLVTEKARSAGILLYAKAVSESGCKDVGVVGQNAVAEAIYAKLGYEAQALSQYYIMRDNSAPAAVFAPIREQELYQIERLNSQKPFKSAAYIINKYLKSRCYKYYAYGTSRGAFIFRIQEYPESFKKRCVRIVEFFGDFCVFSEGGAAFQALMREFGASYIDFYQFGIPEEMLVLAGFERNTGQALLPNYFEPFVDKNIEIRCAYKMNQKKDGFTVYKGDGDRDFPRIPGF